MVKLTKIYTRTGDTGTTGLVDGSRVAKSDRRIAAIGDLDEANSAIGVALIGMVTGVVRDELARIQNDLFDLGADLATPGAIDGALRIVPSQVERLELAIDALNANLLPLTSFILPGGTPSAAGLHLARAVVRRAERSVTAMPDASHVAATYINRLSDYLFVAARALNQNGAGDVLWVPGGTR
ncbi:cob(I)yrinic acid a,c-diamide adenosyltransferase [Sphingomonas sp. Leaf343]|uniref:cob(I)yrinic acid a,c-diamide adenosyltransferase n=1 Tax=Sphingomonas sp. Leaf343 TaxID=1736345 RepID=UPI0006F4FD59|nr:cob(I)yrinic acid a,c-diamide adenosyltransferase [Sphingomonas sp. Leaf343]KQR83569.1 cob(I)yrinic acid a c-diamide adenosyltransferase [Sphingomonas sp. Leaf343]